MMHNHSCGHWVGYTLPPQESGTINSTSLGEISGAMSDMIEVSEADGGLLATSSAFSMLQVSDFYSSVFIGKQFFNPSYEISHTF